MKYGPGLRRQQQPLIAAVGHFVTIRPYFAWVARIGPGVCAHFIFDKKCRGMLPTRANATNPKIGVAPVQNRYLHIIGAVLLVQRNERLADFGDGLKDAKETAQHGYGNDDGNANVP